MPDLEDVGSPSVGILYRQLRPKDQQKEFVYTMYTYICILQCSAVPRRCNTDEPILDIDHLVNTMLPSLVSHSQLRSTELAIILYLIRKQITLCVALASF